MKKIKHYNLIEKLGTGGMGEVYKAYDTALEREVAIKLMHPHLMNEKNNAERFVREARAAAKLVHPNIVTMHEIGTSELGRFIVMEYVQGVPLTDVLEKEGILKIDRVARIMSQVCNGLQKAHDMGILHRDIKTDNILLTNEDVVKILDFGIAKISAKMGLTGEGDILGTVEFMAPEQMMGSTVDQRSDIYALGVVLYQLLTTRLPFTGDSPVEIIYKKLNEEPLPPSYYNKEMNSETDGIVLKALGQLKEERWESADALGKALMQLTLPKTNFEVQHSSVYISETGENDGEKEDEEWQGLRNVFIGRDREFKKLIHHFNLMTHSQGQTIILKGEAGVGKTRLSDRLRSYVTHRNSWTLYGACLYQEGMDAYLPFIDSLRNFFSKESHQLPFAEREKLKNLVRERVPLLLQFTERFTTSFGSQDPQNAAEDKLNHGNLFDGIYLLISYLSSLRPILLIIDDLQWADEASLRLFHYLSRQVSSNKVLLMGITRTDRYDLQQNGKPTPAVDMLSRLRRDGTGEEIELRRLNRPECDQLVEESLGRTLFTEDFLDRLHRETKGNPFFVLETLKLLQEDETIYLKNDVWHDRQDVFKFNVPNKVEDVFIRQISELNDEEREILQIAAVIGYKFDPSLISQLLEIPKLRLLKILHQIETELKLISSTEKEFAFEHPMLRDLLYGEISKALRTEYHLMISKELEKMYDGQYGSLIGDVAQHFYLGGDYKSAIPLLFQGGIRAFKISAYREASLFFEDFLKAMEKDNSDFPKDISSTDFYFNLGICYEEINYWDQSLAAYQKMLEVHQRENNAEGIIQALLRIGRLHYKSGKLDLAIKYYEDCLEKLEKHPVENMHSRIYNNMGAIYFQKEDFEQAREYFSKTIDSVDNEYGEFDRAHAYTNLGIISNVFGEHDNALKHYFTAIDIYHGKGDYEREARVFHNIGMTYSDMGEWDESLKAFQKCLDSFDNRTDKDLAALTFLNMGKAYVRHGNHSMAKKYAEESLKFFKRVNDNLSIAEVFLVLGQVAEQKGNFYAAEKFFKDSIHINEKEGNKEGLAEAFLTYADALLRKGVKDQARDYYTQALAIFKKLKMDFKIEIIEKTLESEVLEKETEEIKVGY